MQSLHTYVEENGPLDVKTALGWALRAAKTLEVVHREDRVFGCMCAEALLVSGDDPAEEGALAHPSTIDMPAAYVSPWLGSGREPDAAGDIWALMVTLYFALSGSLPYPRGVRAWLEAGKRSAPQIAVHASHLTVMQILFEQLLDPMQKPVDAASARLVVMQLSSMSPSHARMPRLPMQLPPRLPSAPPIDLDESDVEIIEDDYTNLKASLPPPLLASLPPAPPPLPAPATVDAPDVKRQSAWLVPTLLAIIAVLAALVIALASVVLSA